MQGGLQGALQKFYFLLNFKKIRKGHLGVKNIQEILLNQVYKLLFNFSQLSCIPLLMNGQQLNKY